VPIKEISTFSPPTTEKIAPTTNNPKTNNPMNYLIKYRYKLASLSNTYFLNAFALPTSSLNNTTMHTLHTSIQISRARRIAAPKLSSWSYMARVWVNHVNLWKVFSRTDFRKLQILP
jgi:hypothetical protein